MILDSSAIVAVVRREPDFPMLVAKLQAADSIAVGAPTITETGIVLEARLHVDGRTLVERFLHEFEVQVLPFEDEHWREAIDAYRRFGRGKHPAGLNFGDCLSYAMAVVENQPLLFIGQDFAKTDIMEA